MTTSKTESSVLTLLMAWLLVGVPLGWGVYNTILNSKKMFQTVPPAVAPASLTK